MSWGFQIETGGRASSSSGGRLEWMWPWSPVVFWVPVSCPSVFLTNSLSSLELIWAGFCLQGWTRSVNTYMVLEFVFSTFTSWKHGPLEDTLFLVKAVGTFPGVQYLGLSDGAFSRVPVSLILKISCLLTLVHIYCDDMSYKRESLNRRSTLNPTTTTQPFWHCWVLLYEQT